jgi:hypothetical protein
LLGSKNCSNPERLSRWNAVTGRHLSGWYGLVRRVLLGRVRLALTYRKIKISCLKSRATRKGSESGCEIPRPDFGNIRAVTNVGLVLVLMSCCFLRQARADTIAAGVNRHQNDTRT